MTASTAKMIPQLWLSHPGVPKAAKNTRIMMANPAALLPTERKAVIVVRSDDRQHGEDDSPALAQPPRRAESGEKHPHYDGEPRRLAPHRKEGGDSGPI